jgi:hypothetical protein
VEPLVTKKNPPPTWDDTPLVAKKKPLSLRLEVDEGPRPSGRPLWMPEGTDLVRTPVAIRQAAAEILCPAYEELVVQAGSGMEKSLGASLVYLLWLEILERYDTKKDYCKFDLLLDVDGMRGLAIDRYLKLVNSKLRLSSMLPRLRQLRLKELNRREGEYKSVGRAPPTEIPVRRASPTMNRSTANFDDQIPALDSPVEIEPPQTAPSNHLLNHKTIHQEPSSKAQDQKVQNSKFAHENQPPLLLPPSTFNLQPSKNLIPKTHANLSGITPAKKPHIYRENRVFQFQTR